MCIHVLAVLTRLAAQLARTEEAAKRALVRADPAAKGSTAQQLLDAQRLIQQLQTDNSDLSSKLARYLSNIKPAHMPNAAPGACHFLNCCSNHS